MEKFLNKLFESREIAHVLHLKTSKYSEHNALQTYYENILDHIDTLGETFQGQFGLLDLSDIRTITDKVDFSNTIKYFESLSEYLLDNRYKVVNDKCKHLAAIIDEILILVFQTIYRLKILVD